MKNIAVNALSRRSKRVWTTPGLGDRALILTFLANYIKKHDTDVCLHLNSSHTANGRVAKWNEIVKLVPRVSLKMHNVKAMDDSAWLEYLRAVGVEYPSLYWFTETPTISADILIHDYLKESPKLEAPDCSSDFDLPKKYMVEQWDSTDPKRRASAEQKQLIRQMFLDQGYELITVGGEATNDHAKYSLNHIAYLMANAEGFVGVNSGMFCMSHMYIDFDKIYYYGKMKQDHVKWFSTRCNYNYGVDEFEAER